VGEGGGKRWGGGRKIGGGREPWKTTCGPDGKRA